ncbi:putative ribonuclease H-like domain-containing protein [Tanacetum coccineum]
MCDKKNSVLFNKTECLVLSPDLKLLDESQVLLKVPRHDNMYSFDLKNVVPSGGLTCLFAKATIDESNLWHRRLGHINFKTMNKLVRGKLVRGLPSKLFENDHTCIACQKGKQHKASCKTKLVSSISQPLQMLHMDLFGPTFVRSINHKTYFLVVTDDFSRFSWVLFLATKDETSGILKTFITGIENQINHKVKIIRCNNRIEFKNNDMNHIYGMKGIKREFSVARTLQQNRVSERKNKTLIEAARTMLADSLLPTTFWAEAVNTACYVQNRVLVTKPHNKTPYELLHGRPPSISFIRPFGCPVTILNTLDPLGKFDGKADEGFLVGYSINSKAFRVFNTRTRKVEENLHITFLKNKPNVAGSGPDWLFDIDLLTNSMNYEPITTGNQTNRNAGIKDNVDAIPTQQYILLPFFPDSPQSSEDAVADDAEGDQHVQDLRAELDKLLVQQKEGYANSTNRVSTVSPSVSTARQSFANDLPTDPLMLDFEDTTNLLNTGIFSGAYDDDEDVGAEADLDNLKTTMNENQPPPSTATPSQEGQVSTVAPSHLQKTQTPRQAKRGHDTEIPQSGGPPKKVGDEAVHKELGDRLERAVTTATSLDVEQDSSGSPRCQKAIGGTIAQTRSERVPTPSYDSPLLGGNTPGSDEEILEQHELTDNVPPTPHDLPLPGGHTPGSDKGRLQQDKLTDIVIALRRLTLVTSKDEEYLVAEDPSKQGRSLIEEIDLDAGILLVPSHDEVQGRYEQNLETQEGFGNGQEVSTTAQVSTAGPEVTTADAELNTASTFVSTASPQRHA